MLVLSVYSSRFPYMSILISGGYSDGAPPLPIPNREVKPVRADGTASSGRVGSRRFFQKSPAFHTMWSAGFLICIICMKAASGLCILLLVYVLYIRYNILYKVWDAVPAHPINIGD